MKFSLRSRRALDALTCLAVLVAAPTASGQSATGNSGASPWRYSLGLNLYLPTIGGSSSFPVDTGTSIDLDAGKILDALKFAFMASAEAHNGRWGAYADVVYFDLGANKTETRDFSIGHFGLPVATTANLDFDLKASVWTLGGEYRVAATPRWTLDIVGGARLLDLRERLNWGLSGDIGPIASTDRTGSATIKQTLWDAIVGVKGRYTFERAASWSMPFYLDVGSGESRVSWQAAGGIAYAFPWGDMSALWRHIDYHMKSGGAVNSLSTDGPMFAATFRW
jgi:hypothetical protein